MALPTVLVVEDDADIRRLVAILLERSGHRVRSCADGQHALRIVFAERPDLVLLDIGLPGLDGWQVLARIRELSDVPIIMLTAFGDELDKVRGLRAGADDFVTKPFGRQELVARVEALLRRGTRGLGAQPEIDVYMDAALTVDHVQRIASSGGTELRLTPLEFRLLSVLVRHAGQLLSVGSLLDLVWGDAYAAAGDQVKLTVGRLRRKLDGYVDENAIETVRGFGYRYRAPVGS